MAEIILPPEEDNEITPPDLPELNIDKPTENSKVITIEFEAKKTNKVSTKDTNQQLYTTDTDAWFEFKETSLEGANGTYSVVFRNRHDGSIFQRTGDVVNGVAYYKIPHQEIRHAGAWRGQLVYTLENGNTTAREFGYDVKGHMLDGKDVREIVVEDFETLMSQLRSMKDNAEVELANLAQKLRSTTDTAEQNETGRQAFFDELVEDIDELQANYQELLETGVLQTNINTKLEQLEEEYAPKLTEVAAQLDHKVDKEALNTEKGRINNLVANAGDTDGNAELLDIRVGLEGNIHTTAGNAVRAIDSSLRKKILDSDRTFEVGKSAIEYNCNRIIEVEMEYGVYDGNTGIPGVENEIRRMRGKDFIIPKDDISVNLIDKKYKYTIHTYTLDGESLGETGYIQSPKILPFSVDKKYRFHVSRVDNTELSSYDLENIYEILVFGEGSNKVITTDKPNDLQELFKNTPMMYGTEKFINTSWEHGSITELGILFGFDKRIRSHKIIPTTTLKIQTLNLDNDYRFAIHTYLVSDDTHVRNSGWIYNHTEIPYNENHYYRVVLGHSPGDFTEGITDIIATSKNVFIGEGVFAIPPAFLSSFSRRESAINSINVEYGRKNGASFLFARIPKVTNDGRKLRPRVSLTSIDRSLDRQKHSTLDYARTNNSIFTLNAGLFNIATAKPIGQTIIDREVIVAEPQQSGINGETKHPDQCYPMGIDGNGDFHYFERNTDVQDMLDVGIVHSVSGWGNLVEDFKIDQVSIDNEIVHNRYPYIRQSIGQFQNGDYFVCTVDMHRGPVKNERGMTYEELAQLLIDKGVKYAYSLDGGGSAQTVLGSRQINPIYEGASGRRVPVVIEFVAE